MEILSLKSYEIYMKNISNFSKLAIVAVAAVGLIAFWNSAMDKPESQPASIIDSVGVSEGIHTSTKETSHNTPASKPKSSCDPNYSGCVPIASDVDCAGGNGNGPAYAWGPVTVVGADIYDLDRDGDGVACE
jgi:hypothetical protein